MLNSPPKRETIKVCIRVRPLLSHEDIEYWDVDEVNSTISSLNLSDPSNQSLQNNFMSKALMDSIYTSQSFHFDKIYGQSSSSQTIYKEMCRDITKSVLTGINGSIFTYGQTTSGKTFTMLGNPKNPGILPCVLKDTFDLIEKDTNNNYRVFCSYIEIYNENIHDLLTDANSLKLIDDNKYGVIVVGAKRVQISNFEDGIKLKDFGEENRKYRDTMINEYSSRSHTIFQIFVESSKMDPDTNSITSRNSILNMVDLAGSEKLHETESQSGETGYINKSLFVLANVINKLAEGKKMHIPYRDSKLTRLLSMALGGNSLITVICNVSPSANNFFQTLSTLRFASRAKVVKLRPNVNEYYDEREMIEMYRNEIRKLQNEIGSAENEEEDSKINVNNNEVNKEEEEKDYKMKYYNEVLNNKRLKLENDNLKKELDNAFVYYSSRNNNNNSNSKNDESNILSPYLNELTNMINAMNIQDKGVKDFYLSSVNQLNDEYLNQLNTLQQFYLNKVKEIHSKIISNFPSEQPQQNKNSNVITSSEASPDDFFTNLKNKNLFTAIPLTFDTNNTIQSIKMLYEKKSDQLEQEMFVYKHFIDDYYNKIYQSNTDPQVKNDINNEFNVTSNFLNEIYEDKLNVLEKNFFETLRKITAFKKEQF